MNCDIFVFNELNMNHCILSMDSLCYSYPPKSPYLK